MRVNIHQRSLQLPDPLLPKKTKMVFYFILFYFLGDENYYQIQQTTLARLLSELRIPAEVRVRICYVWYSRRGIGCEQLIVQLSV